MDVFFFRLRAAALVGVALFIGFPRHSSGAVEQFPGLDAKWRHVRSPHFEIYSRTSESYARNLLANLEAMRAAFFQVLDLPVRDTREVTIYAFRSSGPFQTYASEHFENTKNLIGEYRSFLDRDVILLPTDESVEAARWVIYSDLAKNLLSGSGSVGPSWVSQGLSMFFGNFDSGGKSFTLGEPDSLRESLVRDHPTIDLEEIFAIEEGRAFRVVDENGRGGSQKTTNLFHARCWVLFHYWYCSQKDVPVSDVNRFVCFMLVPANAARPAPPRRSAPMHSPTATPTARRNTGSARSRRVRPTPPCWTW
jgi:hypothetical protein